jgi:23S rRNA (guanosine2251-2'-O)-methyltransferase
MSLLHLRNPHSVLAALRKRPKEVKQIYLPPLVRDQDVWGQIRELARKQGVSVTSSHPPSMLAREKALGRSTSAEAVIVSQAGVSVEELFSSAQEYKQGGGLWLALDCLKDPHNVGAIFRTAAFFGVKGILLTQERSAPLSETVYDVASGGIESVPFSLHVNLKHAFEIAKQAGLWILGTSEHAKEAIQSIQMDRAWLLVFGNEESGLRRLTQESCDVLCTIPAHGTVTSLNVSVAAGILISALSKKH